MTKPRSRAQIQAGARQGLGVATVPFAAQVSAVSLAGRPWDCVCTWVPDWLGVPGGYVAAGFRLKFASAMCPVTRHHKAA